MMVVWKKSIRIVWRDGFFLYLCSEINNNKLRIGMTQGEAVIKALEDLGGKASLKQIYALAKTYVTFGTKTPEESIRAILQRSPKAKQKVKGSGWWELVSYQEEIARLEQTISARDERIQELEAQMTPTAIFERMANMYMNASMNKDKDDRKEVCNILNKIQSRLNLTVSKELYDRTVSFDKDIPMSKINVDGNNNGVLGENIGIQLSTDWQEKLVNGMLGKKLLNNGNSNQG